MSTNSKFDNLARAWLDEGPTQLSDFALEAALDEVHLTRQRRALRVPWRFPTMPALSRATGLAAVALVATVGAGTLYYVSTQPPGSAGSQPTPTPSAGPTAATSTAPSEAAPGIKAWVPYTSAVHGFTMAYPDDWTAQPATRSWQAGDDPFQDPWPWADVFESDSPGDLSIGLLVWEVPVEESEGVDLDSYDDLETWAQGFCQDIGASTCEQVAGEAVPMCHDAGGACRAAILITTDEQQLAFFGDWGSMMLAGGTDYVTVVMLGRGDQHPSTAPYGGGVQLVRSFLTTMGVVPSR